MKGLIWVVAGCEVVFLFLGGAHQTLHLAPVAAELARIEPGWRITCIHDDAETEAILIDVARRTEASILIERIGAPRWGAWLARITGRSSAVKGPRLGRVARRARRAAAIVTPERTSSALRLLGLRKTLMIHFRHGAGDRAPASERRQHRFDLIVVPGEKDRLRAIERRSVPAEKLRVSGYVKLDYLRRTMSERWRPFGGDRPLVVYNPHFDLARSSWPVAAQIVAAFARQDRYALALAPHIRLAENMDAEERARWQAMAVPGRIAIDLGSPRLLDMSWLRAADIYLGDVSSQLYEFLADPRPVAFVDAPGAYRADDPRYAGWQLGEIARGPDDVIAAIDRAVERQGERAAAQIAAVDHAFGTVEGACARGARIVSDAVRARHA